MPSYAKYIVTKDIPEILKKVGDIVTFKQSNYELYKEFVRPIDPIKSAEELESVEIVEKKKKPAKKAED